MQRMSVFLCADWEGFWDTCKTCMQKINLMILWIDSLCWGPFEQDNRSLSHLKTWCVYGIIILWWTSLPIICNTLIFLQGYQKCQPRIIFSFSSPLISLFKVDISSQGISSALCLGWDSLVVVSVLGKSMVSPIVFCQCVGIIMLPLEFTDTSMILTIFPLPTGSLLSMST